MLEAKDSTLQAVWLIKTGLQMCIKKKNKKQKTCYLTRILKRSIGKTHRNSSSMQPKTMQMEIYAQYLLFLP